MKMKLSGNFYAGCMDHLQQASQLISTLLN